MSPIPPVQHGSPAAVPDGKTGEAPLYRFAHNPSNPRGEEEYDAATDEELAALGATVKKFGVLQPITVCPVEVWLEHHPKDRGSIGPDVWWIIVIGNRRFASARTKGVESLAFVRNDSVGEVIQAKKTSLIENHHRKSVNPILEAMEIEEILTATGATYRELAEELGFSHGLVYQRLQLLKLVDGFRRLVATKKLSADKALAVAKLTPAEQEKLLALGPPYSPARLHVAAEEPTSATELITRSAVSIPKSSPPSKVVDVLVDKLHPALVAEVTRLLTEKIAKASTPE